MKVNGTNGADTLRGTGNKDTIYGLAGDDFIDGARGRDWIDGGVGNDTLTGGLAGDVFVFRQGDGDDTITDYNSTDGDRVLFDFSSYSDYMLLTGKLYDGFSWTEFTGSTTFTLNASDVNGDGVADTVITVSDLDGVQTLTLLGVSPDQIDGHSLFGG